MKINKICTSIALFILCINIINISYADIDSTSNVPTINSRAAIVFDRTSKTILYGKNENQERKMASTTKIMTSLLIIENCNLNETVEVSKKAASINGSRVGLTTGCKMSIQDLLYGLMLCSGNDAAIALAEHAAGSVENFANMMNNKAKELGLEHTNFVTPHGLDDDNHYTTAYELALLTDYALENQTFANIVKTTNYTITINKKPKSIHNTNELLGYLDGVYGVKTGFTNGANRCLVTACKRGDLDLICIVLGADTKQFRSQDSTKLLEYAFSNYKMVNIEELVSNEFNNWKNENLSKITINKITKDSNLDLEISEISNPIIPIKKEKIDKIVVEISCPNFLEAPLESKASVGKIYVTCNNTEILQLDILNKNEIKKKGFLYNLFDLIKNYSKNLELNF